MGRLPNPRLSMDSPDSRILLVEDHQDTREFLEVVLAQSKYEVKSASTINEALELADAHSFGLFIFDSVLPDGSGVDLCRRVRKSDDRTPIIFYSGLAYEADIKNALRAGAQGYSMHLSNPPQATANESRIAYPSYKSFDQFIDINRLKSLDEYLLEKLYEHIRTGSEALFLNEHRLDPAVL
jgi:two-component system OmpR family response regulator